jgi:hypothetical protein
MHIEVRYSGSGYSGTTYASIPWSGGPIEISAQDGGGTHTF